MNLSSKYEQLFLKGGRVQLRRKEREYQSHRKEILSAAEGVFAEKGFFSSTMSEIAERAEFGTGTLYKYFKSKEDLYFTLVDEKTDEINKLVKNELARETSAIERLRSVLSLQLEFIEKNRDFFRIYVSDRSRFEWTVKDELGREIHDKMIAYIKALSQVMEQGIREGELKAMDPTDLAHALVGIVNSFMFEWLVSPRPDSLVSKKHVALEIFLKGTQRMERRK
jgi:AcrR family transcriptional regulator